MSEQLRVPPVPQRRSSLASRRAVAAALAVVVAILGLYVTKAAIPESALRLPFDTVLRTRDVLPQGWAFFTKSPREPNTTYWRFLGGRWEESVVLANADPANAFGLRRTGRSGSIQAASLVSEASAKGVGFTACTDHARGDTGIVGCLEHTEPSVIDRSTLDWTLCGQVAAVAQEPLPWAWAQAGMSSDEMPFSVMRFDVRCSV